jgi:predicted nucleotidyltransferase
MKKYSELDKQQVQGLPGYTKEDIISILKPYLDDLESDGDFRVKNITIIGSRTRGTAKKNSDLDVLVEYEGSMREDDAFNALHYDPIYIEDIPVDINPIRKEESGTTEEWLERSEKYLNSLSK